MKKTNGQGVRCGVNALPDSVVEATSKRYLEAYRRLTGQELAVR